MSLVDEQWEFLKDIASLILFAEVKGYKLTGGELYRPQEMQEIYYRTGRSKTLNSNHGLRLAQDFNVFKNGKLTWSDEDIRPLGEYWESLSPQNRWGGNFRSFIDRPHFERVRKRG